ncbi:hypothetical protein HZA45_03305 [Candidatus Peregrinibacteria bacterium]|nr:hypothetical protein [Candidatus Peregrinibacteria bacterium]
MKKYSRFIFDSFAFDPKSGKIELHYSLDDEVSFTETIILPVCESGTGAPDAELQHALFALHLIGGISYYKTCLPKIIEIRSGSLTEKEAAFWTDVYENGLGEFFYKNDIDFRGLIRFPAADAPPPNPLPRGGGKEKMREGGKNGERNRGEVLVPIGGGKDSIVTAELLKKAGKDVTLLRVGHHPLINEVAKIAGLPLLTVERHLSPALFDLNAAGALNGHVPITAYLSILSVIIAMTEGFEAVVWSNERSASEGNVTVHGKEINHQWSKSMAFEKSFSEYLAESIGTNIASFSLLRPWSELRIVREFTKFPQYFGAFTSCNKNWKILSKPLSPTLSRGERGKPLWCCCCPKCAFAFLLLAAFLPEKTIIEIFGKNLFEDEALLPLYRELLGLTGIKPFECVGTPEECQAAFFLAQEKGEWEQTAAMKIFMKESAPSVKDSKKLIERELSASGDHMIPEEYNPSR